MPDCIRENCAGPRPFTVTRPATSNLDATLEVEGRRAHLSVVTCPHGDVVLMVRNATTLALVEVVNLSREVFDGR